MPDLINRNLQDFRDLLSSYSDVSQLEECMFGNVYSRRWLAVD
jgi:hypothetical protein